MGGFPLKLGIKRSSISRKKKKKNLKADGEQELS